MEIICPACKARFMLRADKVPRTPFRVSCGKCQHPFTVSPREVGDTEDAAAEGLPVPAAMARPSSPPAPPALSGTATVQEGSDATAPPAEEFQENLRLALVCESRPDAQAQVVAALRDLGYKTHIASAPQDALAWLYQNRYEVLFLHEEFAGGSLDRNEVLLGLKKVQMGVRRHICVGLSGRGFRTMDHAAAFQHSVNFVVSERDYGRLSSIIRTAVADNDHFYRVFKETMQQLGRT